MVAGIRGAEGHLMTAMQAARRSDLRRDIFPLARRERLTQEGKGGVVATASCVAFLADAGEQVGLTEHTVTGAELEARGTRDLSGQVVGADG
jgi:hypothetical protein